MMIFIIVVNVRYDLLHDFLPNPRIHTFYSYGYYCR